MGLFSAIGGALGSTFGPLGQAVGSGLGSALDGKILAKDQNKAEANKFVRLRAAAEKGGFHPLEALRAGYEVGWSSPRLVSGLARANAFDAFEDELTGEAAKQRRREQVDDELRERQLEILKYDVARQQLGEASIRNVPTKGGRLPPARGLVDADAGSPTSADQVEVKPATVTALHPDDGSDLQKFSNPWRGDGGAFEERYGDAELVTTGYAAWAIFDDFRYNLVLSMLSDATGKTRREIHKEIQKDPMAHGGATKLSHALMQYAAYVGRNAGSVLSSGSGRRPVIGNSSPEAGWMEQRFGAGHITNR
jgi:hypothetical protein